MDKWMDGWIDGWMDRWVRGWIDSLINGWFYTKAWDVFVKELNRLCAC